MKSGRKQNSICQFSIIFGGFYTDTDGMRGEVVRNDPGSAAVTAVRRLCFVWNSTRVSQAAI